MTPTEDRLRELAEHRRGTARVDPQLWGRVLEQTERPRRTIPWRTPVFLGAAVAAIVAAVAVVAGGLLADDDREPVAAGPIVTVPPEEFVELVDPVCGAFAVEISGNEPRFATPEAYDVAGTLLRGAAEAAAAALLAVPPPADDTQIVGRLVNQMRNVAASAGQSVDAAATGDLVLAGELFDAAGRQVGDFFAELRAAGARCPFPATEEDDG